MKNQQGNIALILAATLFGVLASFAAYYFYNESSKNYKYYKDEKEKKEHLLKLNEISISEGIRTELVQLELLNIDTEITLRHTELYKKPKGWAGFLDDLVDIAYQTNYSFTYGYNLKDWNWCAIVDKESEGVVNVRLPKEEWTNKHKNVMPDTWITVKAIFYDDLKSVVESDVKKKLSEKLKKTSEKHLNDSGVIKTMRRSLSDFLVEIMNASHKDSNPVRKVNFVDNLDSECKEIPQADAV